MCNLYLSFSLRVDQYELAHVDKGFVSAADIGFHVEFIKKIKKQ